jgi:hypothetical protein
LFLVEIVPFYLNVGVIEWGNWCQAAVLSLGGVDEEEVMLKTLILGSSTLTFNL